MILFITFRHKKGKKGGARETDVIRIDGYQRLKYGT